MQAKEFYNKFAPLARKVQNRYKVPCLATLAQCALESGWGEKHIGSANNYFGIKANSAWKGKVVNANTKEVYNKVTTNISAYFRAYDNAEASFMDYGNFLTVNSRYKNCFATQDPKMFLKRVCEAGYATDPNYYTKLEKIVNTLLEYHTEGGSGNGGVLGIVLLVCGGVIAWMMKH